MRAYVSQSVSPIRDRCGFTLSYSTPPGLLLSQPCDSCRLFDKHHHLILSIHFFFFFFFFKDSDLFCCCCFVVVVFCRVLQLHSVAASCKLDMVSGIYFTVRGLLVNSSGPPNHSATPYRWVYARNLDAATCSHSSGAVWESRWTSWAVRPNEPSGFCGRKDLLNSASALVTTCP